MSFYAQASWEENALDIKVKVNNKNINGESNIRYSSHAKNLGVELQTTQLFNGWGFSGTHSSSYISLDTETKSNHYDNQSKLNFNLFIRDNINVETQLHYQSTLKFDGILTTNFLTSRTPVYLNNLQSGLINLNAGNDNDYWSMNIAINAEQSDYKDTKSRAIFRESNKNGGNLSAAWKVSEDSYLTVRYGVKNNVVSLNNSRYDTSIANSYIGFKTKYLKSSQVIVDLGSTSTSGYNTSVAWNITNKTFINDYFSATLSNGR